MPNPFKIDFETEIERLRNKPKTWKPSKTLDDFVEGIRLIIETSRYTDSYKRMNIDELTTILRLKTSRVINYADIEEMLDVCAYMYLLFDKKLGES